MEGDHDILEEESAELAVAEQALMSLLNTDPYSTNDDTFYSYIDEIIDNCEQETDEVNDYMADLCATFGDKTVMDNQAGDFRTLSGEDYRLDNLSSMAVIDSSEELIISSDSCKTNSANEFPPVKGQSFESVESVKQDGSNQDNQLLHMDDWYIDPYSDEFKSDMKFIEDFWRPDRALLRWALADGWTDEMEELWLASLRERRLNKEINEFTMGDYHGYDQTCSTILESIRVPGFANEGVQKLYEYLKIQPELDLKIHLTPVDMTLKRFVIWSLNYLYSIDQDPGRTYPGDSQGRVIEKSVVDEEKLHERIMKKLSIRLLPRSDCIVDVQSFYWDLLLDNFLDCYYSQQN